MHYKSVYKSGTTLLLLAIISLLLLSPSSFADEGVLADHVGCREDYEEEKSRCNDMQIKARLTDNDQLFRKGAKCFWEAEEELD